MSSHKGGRKEGGRRRNHYIQPSLLMALLEGHSYGYELIRQLPDYGFMRDEPAPGMIYRHLRQMEEDGMVESEWDSEGSGPAKRIYTITDHGREVLQAWVEHLERQAAALNGFVARYQGFETRG